MTPINVRAAAGSHDQKKLRPGRGQRKHLPRGLSAARCVPCCKLPACNLLWMRVRSVLSNVMGCMRQSSPSHLRLKIACALPLQQVNSFHGDFPTSRLAGHVPAGLPSLPGHVNQRHPSRHALHGQRPRDRACVCASRPSLCFPALVARTDPSGRTAQREQGSTSRRTKALASTFAALASVNDARRTLPAAEMMPGFTALLTLASIFCFASDFKLRNFI